MMNELTTFMTVCVPSSQFRVTGDCQTPNMTLPPFLGVPAALAAVGAAVAAAGAVVGAAGALVAVATAAAGAGVLVAAAAAGALVAVAAAGLVAVGGTGVAVGVPPQAERSTAAMITRDSRDQYLRVCMVCSLSN